MKIAYYMPFKPMGHPNPSGDLMIGTGLYDYFQRQKHPIRLMSKLRCRWIYKKPLLWPQLIREGFRVVRDCRRFQPDVWMSYHTYYKAPDLLGPACCRRLHIPYVIFQGIYSTKRRRKLTTLPGFLLNRFALNSAQMVFTNKRQDEKNLQRLLPDDRIHYIPPGILPQEFSFSPSARKELHEQWKIDKQTVIMTAAMFRPGVKTEGIRQVINTCHNLKEQGNDILLTIAGDGSNRHLLEKLAAEKLPGSVRFLGKIPRHELHRYYSGADFFVFPGIKESLGMVYLEAQACRLPVVALEDWGAKEAIIHNQTGLLSPASNPQLFADNINHLISRPELRQEMAHQAELHVRTTHDLEENYSHLSGVLRTLIQKK